MTVWIIRLHLDDLHLDQWVFVVVTVCFEGGACCAATPHNHVSGDQVMVSVIVGLLGLALGLWGLTAWWWSVTEFLRGAMPIVFIIFGLVALASGVQTVRQLPKGSKRPSDQQGETEANE
jgi:hypothetical protein